MSAAGATQSGVARSGGALLADPFALALRATLFILLLDAALFWFQRLPVMALAGVGLVLPGAWRSRWLWGLLAAATAWPLVWNWPFSDNHDYLRALWALGIWASLGTRSPAHAVALNGRLLVGLTFLFGTLWKVALSPDFLDGSFFRVTLLTDARFHDLAVLAGGMSWDGLDAYDTALAGFLAGDARAFAASGFVEPAALRLLARGATLYTAAVEAAIALGFLWPREGGPRRFRNAALLLFALSTYTFATVRGFGWLLCVQGIAQTRAEERRARALYLLAIFAIEAYRSVPWSRWLVDALGAG